MEQSLQVGRNLKPGVGPRTWVKDLGAKRVVGSLGWSMKLVGFLGCPLPGVYSPIPNCSGLDSKPRGQKTRNWEDGSVAKVLTMQVERTEFNPQHPCKKKKKKSSKVAMLVILALQGRWIHGTYWASQSSPASKPQVPVRDPKKNQDG